MSGRVDTIRVLHVDDEPSCSSATAAVLERADDRFSVETASTASEGLERLREAEFDCVVSDYAMPGQDGIEFLERVRTEHPAVPFVIFTGKGSEAVASEAVSAGVSDYLRKEPRPEQYEQLAESVANAVAERDARQFSRAVDHQPMAVFDQLFDGFVSLDSDWRFVYVNERAGELFGKPAGELLGACIWDLFPEVTETPFYDHYHDAVETGKPRTVEAHFEPWDTWYREHLYPSGDGLSVLFRDITEEKQHEQEREATVEFLKGLYEIATDRNLDADAKISKLLTVGPEKLGLPYGTLTRIERDGDGTATQTIVEASGDHDLLEPGESCPLSQSYCRRTIETDGLLELTDAVAAGWGDDPAYERFGLDCYVGIPIEVDGELYGTVFFASKRTREEPFSDTERAFVRLMSQLVSDELERRRSTEQLQRRNERLDEFARVVSHDLRNPLNVASGRLDIARRMCENDQLDSQLGAIERAHGRMEELIDDLLSLAREGEQVSDVAPVDLGELVDCCWQHVDTGNVTLVTDLGGTVRADRSRLKQLLENLLRNAVEHASSSGSFTRSAGSGGDSRRDPSADADSDDTGDGEAMTVTIGEIPDGFYVEDNGPGIPEPEREAVFEPGYSTRGEGTGFGLSIVEQVAEAHGWTVSVTEGSDGGARFEITGVDFES